MAPPIKNASKETLKRSARLVDFNTKATDAVPTFSSSALSLPKITQNNQSVAIGENAGQTTQGNGSVAVGVNSGQTTQGNAGIAVGFNAGKDAQGSSAVALGAEAGKDAQGVSAVAIGIGAGQTTQGGSAVAIGASAGQDNQATNSIAVGFNSGRITQGNSALAIGAYAGNSGQSMNAIAVGKEAGSVTQGSSSVAIGSLCGYFNQGKNSVAVGADAGNSMQSASAVAVGIGAGSLKQGINTVAIGSGAGRSSQGAYSIAIGSLAGETNQSAKSICLNATGVAVNPETTGLFIDPIRIETPQLTPNMLSYNPNTKEITYSTSGVTKAMVGLGNVDNTSDANKPVSTAQQAALDLKAPLASPAFTGTVSGVTKAMVGLGDVDNTSDANKPVSNAQQTALDLKAPLASPAFTGTVISTTPETTDSSTRVATTKYVKNVVSELIDSAPETLDTLKELADALGNDHNLSATLTTSISLKAPLNNPAFTGTVSGVTKAMVGLGDVDNTSDADNPVSTAQQAALDLTAPLASPAFTGTVSGVTKAMVGLGNVDNTSDANKPVSTAQQAALDLKAPLASPAFTGTVSGVTKAMVGLGDVDNTSDANKPVSNAQQTALDLKAPLASPAFTGTVISTTPETTDSSTRVATTKYVKNVVSGLEHSYSAYLGDGNVQIPLPTRPFDKLNLISLGHKNVPYFENFDLNKFQTQQTYTTSNITAAVMFTGSVFNLLNLLIADNGKILRYKISNTIDKYYPDSAELVASVWLDSAATQPGTIHCFSNDFFGEFLYFGGNFTTITYPGTAPNSEIKITQHCIGRMGADFKINRILQSSGGICGVNGPVYALAYNALNKRLYVGGSFTSVMPAESATSVNTNLSNLVEIILENNGNSGSGYQAFFNGGFDNNTLRVTKSGTNPARVNSIVYNQTPNAIFVGGDFTHAGKPGNEVSCENFVRFGTFQYDPAPIPLFNLNAPINSMVFGRRGILISGKFTNVQVETPHLPCINSGTPIPPTLETNYANYSLYFDPLYNRVYAGGPVPKNSETDSLVLSSPAADSIIYKATNRVVTTRNGVDWHDRGSVNAVAPNSVVFFRIDNLGICYTGHSNDSPNILHRSNPVELPKTRKSVKFILPNARFRSTSTFDKIYKAVTFSNNYPYPDGDGDRDSKFSGNYPISQSFISDENYFWIPVGRIPDGTLTQGMAFEEDTLHPLITPVFLNDINYY